MPISIFQCTIIQSSPRLGLYIINGLLTSKYSCPLKRPLMVHCRHQNSKKPFHLLVTETINPANFAISLPLKVYPSRESGVSCFIDLFSIVQSSDLKCLHAHSASKFALCRRAGPIKTMLGSLPYLTHWNADFLPVVSFVHIHV